MFTSHQVLHVRCQSSNFFVYFFICLPPQVSGVTCHVSRVTCQVSHVICKNFFLFFFIKKMWSQLVEGCYQRGLPRLVLTVMGLHFLSQYPQGGLISNQPTPVLILLLFANFFHRMPNKGMVHFVMNQEILQSFNV